MKFLIDNNLSPYLARALAALSSPHDIEVIHLRDKFLKNTPDIEWINALSTEQGWSVVTQDRLIKNPLEKEALRRSGLTAFVLAKGWSAQLEWDKAAQLVRWWPRIIEQASLVRGGAAFQVPWKISGKGQFKQIQL